ncbi:RDD family protein [Pseudofulvibacter geojedonensis]|uniref:RDD family protein n=1 Tax=Pseudofulvibacter geojedonensis TaxID=1123758 RepID=A0ABW3HZI3_9FLAO
MLQINTTQNVKISFGLADVGYRILAFGLDFIILVAYLFVLFNVFNFGALINAFGDSWSQTAMATLGILPVVLYTLVSEILLQGQTVGKKILKLKVLKVDGFQAAPIDFMIRWFFRSVEIYGLLFFSAIAYAAGFFETLFIIGITLTPIAAFIVLVSGKQNQRFGDMVAGTTVVRLKNSINISHTILEEIQSDYQPTYHDVIKLSDNDARIIKETFLAAKKNKDYAILIKLRKKIEEVTGITNNEKNDLIFLDKVMKDYNYFTQNM